MSRSDLRELTLGLKLPADPRVLVGIKTSDDAGVFELEGSGRLLIQTVDFITPLCDDPRWFGRVAAANSFSDVYAMGGRPLTALNVCCFPHRGLPKAVLAEILEGGLEVVLQAGAALVGGQSVKDPELKYGLAVTGIAARDELTPNSGARPGDRLILTKRIGTGVLIGGYRSRAIDEQTLMPAVRQMAELNRTAAEVMRAFGCQGATDITGFGLGGHAWEMAEASGLRLVFYAAAIPCYPESEALVKANQGSACGGGETAGIRDRVVFDDDVPPARRVLFDDPQTSGGLLIAVAESKAEPMLKELHDRGVADAALVGHAEASSKPELYLRLQA